MEGIVFDSSTAILLAKISLLRMITRKTKAIFPKEVKKETTKKEKIFDSQLIMELIKENQIEISESNQKIVNKFLEDFNIEKGEAEALEIAKRKQWKLATDDGPTIKACKILDIKFITAIHFLVESYKEEQINKSIALQKLKLLETYGRYNYGILKNAKQIMEES